MKAAFGVDIGGTNIKLGLVGREGNLVFKWEIPTRVEDHGKHILQDVADSIRIHMQEQGISSGSIQGIGLALPGPVQEDGIVNHCLNLGWGIVNAQAELQALTGWQVVSGNDGSMAALGEMWLGSARECSDFVMVTLGTGIGGGIVVNRRPLMGCNGSAGEIGHILLNADELKPCVCGKHGCLEQYGSARALAEIAREYLHAHPEEKTVLREEGLTAREVALAAARGDPLAMRLLDGLADALGKGMSIIGTIVNPKLFVIGGGLSRAGDMLINRIQAAYRRYVFHAARETPFLPAMLGNNAAIYGCAKAILLPE